MTGITGFFRCSRVATANADHSTTVEDTIEPLDSSGVTSVFVIDIDDSHPLSAFNGQVLHEILSEAAPSSRRNAGKNTQRGVAMVEFALLLPVFSLLIAGVALVGTFLLQVHVVTDGTRKAARTAAAVSNAVNDCSKIKLVAKKEAQQFLNDFSLQANLGDIVNRWAKPVTTIRDASWDGYTYQAIDVELVSQNENCALCFLGINPAHNIPTKSTFMLEGPCV